MKKVEVFFDYNCPYCLKGHEQLLELIKDTPELEIIWNPCEISVFKNPSALTHNDISLQGMFFAAENNVDLWSYHQKVYDIVFKDRLNTKDIDIFANALKGLLDTKAFREALISGGYSKNLEDANNFAFKTTGVHVVPTYRSDGGVLQDRQEFYGMGTSDTSYGGSKKLYSTLLETAYYQGFRTHYGKFVK